MKRFYSLGIIVLIAGLSGFCSLIHLVVWDRAVKYNLGGDSISSAVIAGTFLLGLGLGAYLFGKCRKDAYKTYAFVELAIGLFGILSFYLISPVAATLMQVLKTTPEEVEGLRVVVVAGCTLLLLPLCSLIGGTLPLMLRCFVKPLNFSARSIGLVYGINTFGACLGILALPLFFLNHTSLPATLATIGGIRIILACLILLWSRRLPVEAVAEVEKREAADMLTAGAESRPLIFALAFVSGFITICFTLSLFRAFPIVNPSSAYNFPVVLVIFLLALALGSIVFTRGVPESRDAILYRVGWLTTGSALGMFLGIWIASRLQGNWYPVSFMPILDGAGYANAPWVLLFCVVLIMPLSFLTGAIFPLLLRLRAPDGASLPDSAGKIYLINSLGGFSGLILGTFAGFPVLGTQGFLTLVYLLTCASGIGVMLWVWRRNMVLQEDTNFSGALPAGMLALSVILFVIIPPHIWLTYITGGPEPNWEVREGVTGVAQLWWEEDFADVRVNGQYVSRLPFHPRHVKQEIFLLAQPRRENMLVLGMGGAEIIRTLVGDDEIKSIDLVEGSYELPRLLAGGKAGEMLDHALSSPKIRILKTDARVAVGLYEPETFDVIFDNLAFTSWAGASSLKSETYYRKIRRILKPEGVFVISANYSDSDGRLGMLAGLVKTFEIVKEHANGEIVLAVSKETEYSDARIIEVAEPRAAIFGLNYTAPDALAAWFRNEQRLIGSEQLQGVEPIRDDLPVHEYYWRPL